MIVVLAGGVGAARFLEGLIRVVPQEDVTVISNTGDDVELYGLHVSPDIDTVIYTLSGAVNQERGWGLIDETFNCLRSLERFGYETWFNLGDRDLATHIHRTLQLRSGATLSEVTDSLARARGLNLRVLPMTDGSVRTQVLTPAGWLPFQEYFVKRRAEDEVSDVRFDGIERASPASGVLEALAEADAILIAPSNPIVSIGPILALPIVREQIAARRDRVVAVSPIIGGATIKGPADKMLRGLGHDASALGVARFYQDIIGSFVLDEVDRAAAPDVAKLDMTPVVTNTIMRDLPSKIALAKSTLGAIGVAV